MDFLSAFIQMVLNGKKIQADFWLPDDYVYLNGSTVFCDGEYEYQFSIDDVKASWRIYEG